MKHKILLIGPLPPPITGESLANKVVANYLPKYTNLKIDTIDMNYKVLKEDIGKFNLKKVLYFMSKYKNISKIKSVDKVYITIGQTFFGVLKYFSYIFMAKLYNKEVIIHIHGNHLWKEYESLTGIKKKIFHKILSMADKGIVLSKSLKKNLTPFLSNDKIYILENFVEDYLFDNDLNKSFDKLRIIYLSNLMREKGILDLLEALKILKSKNIDFEAKIAGGIDPKMENILNKYFEELKNNVKYLGIVYGEEKKKLLNWGNIFILPTYYSIEGQPISVLEAMSTGNIILTTRQGGIPDIFKEGKNGFYVDKKSPTSIVEKLISINNKLKTYKYISEYNISIVKDKYTVKNFIKNLEKILKA